MKYLFLFFLFSLPLVFQGCESKQTIQKVLRKSYGKQINLNLPMEYVYEDTTLDAICQPELPPIKVVVYISGQLCAPCFRNYLSTTSEYVDKFSSDSVQYICVMYPCPIEEIQEAMDSLELSHTVVLYDREDQYLKKNSLEKYTDMLSSFLLDKNNRVVLVGDPLRSTDIQKLYTEKIRELIANGGELPKKKSLMKKR